MRCFIAACLFFASVFHSAVAQSSLASRVLVVYASNDPDSMEVARYYRDARGVPQSNMCGVTLNNIAAGDLSPSDYVSQIRTPVRNCLNSVGATNILYIVVAYMRPYRSADGGPLLLAVDSVLADIWDQYTTQYFTNVPTATHRYYPPGNSACAAAFTAEISTTMSVEPGLLDANVLVYAVEASAPQQQLRAR